MYLKPLNMEEHLLGCKHNRHNFLRKKCSEMHFSSFWEHPYSSIPKSATWRHCKSQVLCSQGTYYHHKCFHPRTHCRSRVIFFPRSIANGRVTDSRQIEEKELWTGKTSHKTGTQNSAAMTTIKKPQFLNSSPHAKYPCQTNTFANRKGINIWQVLQKGLSCWQKSWCLLIGGSFPTPFVVILAGPLSNENWGIT